MALEKVGQKQLISGAVERTGMSRKAIMDAANALADEAAAWLSEGFRVDFLQVALVEPRYVKPIRKGTLVRNPATGNMQPSQGRAAALGMKAKPGPKAKRAAPEAKSKAGKKVIAALT